MTETMKMLESLLADLIECSTHYWIKKETLISEISELQRIDEKQRSSNILRLMSELPSNFDEEFKFLIGTLLFIYIY